MAPCGCPGRNKVIRRKIVILGDGACGKTSLLNVFTRGYFPQVYEPTIFENYVCDMYLDDQHIELLLWDTAGQEGFDRLRALSYADTHVILLCFSVDYRDSLENIEHKWMEEIIENCPGVKICLVALKCDLREDPRTIKNLQEAGQKPITYEEGLEVARNIQAARYLECSALLDRGVKDVFQHAAKVSLKARAKGSYKTRRCTIL
ncbi:173_t:CDS:2 [Paraglomus occultum]|uniref:GTP-binding protein RHO3 n=1 Tax=Paraglomus occultum TaxID=144539 RepID=A0A9N8ZR17_9GLOM|nr:173_t:CDS:2 [Paraglomus occultum]